MPRWTTEQQEAIDKEGSNILVSAGAGSGKTAVLSERALRKVKAGVDIDRILILTFTKAAAYEMMIRIRNKIKDAGLLDQVARMDKAYITTFDSFALSVVKKYHERLNLDKNVSIVDENVIDLYKKEKLEEIVDLKYHNLDDSFSKLVTDFCLRDDKELKKYILAVNNKLDLKYDKNEYLDSYVDNFYNEDSINRFIDEYESYISGIVKTLREHLRGLELALDYDDYKKFGDLLEGLIQAKNYDEVRSYLPVSLPRLPKGAPDEAKKDKDGLKKSLDLLCEWCSFDSISSMKEGYLSTRDYIVSIIDIIKKLDKEVEAYKYKYNIFEFTDISKLAIKLVTDYEDIRNELKEFFNEIMIDEYQDTSDLQELFIKKLENNNVYMVGDIKQSIYRFRNANPFIFKEKYDKYARLVDGYKIDLNKNFRSRKEVLDNINKIFDRVMDLDYGGADYSLSHQMVFGNNTYVNEGLTEQNYDLDIFSYHVDKESKYNQFSKDEIEAFIIGRDILDKVNSKYKIFDKDKLIIRNVLYSDFVILMDRSSKFSTYKKIFEYLKVPLTILRDENIMNQDEVYLIRNLLKLVLTVNSRDDMNAFKYSFISIARSYLFRYSDQEIFSIIKNQTYDEVEIIKLAKEIAVDLDNFDLSTLLMTIIDKYHFYEKMITVGNMDMGISVLEYLVGLAKNLQALGYDYEKFILYLDNIIASEKEIKIPVSVEDENSCRIMTIHKSKGLEYPVCYYSGLAAPFNVSDLREKILFDQSYGIIAPCFIDGYQDTFMKNLMKNKYYQDEIGEKIRLFYVALTRSKEKMIVVADIDHENMGEEEIAKDTYRSFLDVLRSIYDELDGYDIPIDLDKVGISSDYRVLKAPMIEEVDSKDSLVVDEREFEVRVKEKAHFSKTVHELIDKDIKKNMEFGTKIHELFELVDFKNPRLEELSISDYEKKCVSDFLELPLLEGVNEANILKEYEFFTVNDDLTESHGIIDLMLEYDDHIDIIDYKLKNIDDSNYFDQLRGYQKYIEGKTKKKTNIYLYSILGRKLQEIK